MARPVDPQRRQDILQAARAVFWEQGFTGARIADIAARAGVAQGTVYLYFESKEALVVALVEDFINRSAAGVLAVFEQSASPEAIAEAVHTEFAFLTAERDLLRLQRLDSGLGMQALYQPLPARQRVHQQLAAALAAKMECGEVRRYDPLVLAELLTALIVGVVESYLICGDGDLTRYEQALTQFLQHALLPGEM